MFKLHIFELYCFLSKQAYRLISSKFIIFISAGKVIGKTQCPDNFTHGKQVRTSQLNKATNNNKENINGFILKGVIFDVDGTLVDSNDLHVEAWQEAFRRYGKEVAFNDVRRQIGKGGDQLMPVFCSPEELENYGSELEQYRGDLFKSDYLPRVKPFPKVRELFERIKADGLQIALASSAKEDELETHKKNLGIEELLETATSADDVEKSKPNPDIFQAALTGLKNVKPEESVVVGDTPYDVIAAKKAGIQTIGLLSGGFKEEDLRQAGAVEIYRDAADLLEQYEQSILMKRPAKTAGMM
jgi:HAD superfamily hydrolase (TIGR01509 family)